eukprot:g4768.t1
MLRTERDDEWREWMAMNRGELRTARVHFLYGGSPAFASGATVMQNRMVESLRRSGYSVRVDIVDSPELADALVAEVEQATGAGGGTGKPGSDVVLVVDGIALLFMHAHLAWLRGDSLRGSIAVVHVPFSSDATYLREGWVRCAVPGEHADFAAAVRAHEVRCFAAVSRVLAVACEEALVGAYGVEPGRVIATSPEHDCWTPAAPLLPRRQPGAPGTGEGGAGRRAFVSVGTLCARKNQLVLLEALAALRDSELPRGWRLHLVGEQSAEPEYAARVRALAGREPLAGHVELRGALPQAETFALMASCDALLFPSLSESFGMVADEAVRIGLPVLAFRGVGPAADLLPAAASVLVADATDIRAWADALRICESRLPALQAAAAAEAARRAAMREVSNKVQVQGAAAREQMPLAQAIHELCI